MVQEDPLIDLKWDYTERFLEELKRMDEKIIGEIYEIGRKNSLGNLAIIGGFVSRPIIENLYNRKTERKNGVIDVDFVADFLNTEPFDPSSLGWTQKRTKFVNPSYRKDHYSVVPNDLRNFHSLRDVRQPTIDDLLDHTPLNIQSIAWKIIGDDLFTGELIGNKGITAIHDQIVKINDFENVEYEMEMNAAYEAMERGYTSEEVINYVDSLDLKERMEDFAIEKARQFGFDYELSSPIRRLSQLDILLRKLGFISNKNFIPDDLDKYSIR